MAVASLELIVAGMTDEELQAYAERSKENQPLVDAIAEVVTKRTAEREAAKAIEAYHKAVDKLVRSLPAPPPEVKNLYFEYGDHDVPTGGEVEVKNPETGEVEKVQAVISQKSWVLTTNKAMKVGTDKMTTPTVGKLAIRVSKIGQPNADGNRTLTPIGEFANGTIACNTLGLTIGKQSANLVLRNSGYHVENIVA